jgi:hypothetical protein
MPPSVNIPVSASAFGRWRRPAWAALVLGLVASAVAAGAWFARASAAHAAGAASVTRVEAIYPSPGRLPANLLRIYVVFSAPMTAGESRTRLRLVDAASGAAIAHAFLELDDELWDPSGRRLTMLFDPGRIKRGLRANLEMGPPLVEGRRYRLVVDKGWLDARGRPLQEGFIKTFEITAPHRAVPDPNAWSIESPTAHTREPLIVRFDEVLDRALLFVGLGVMDEDGRPLDGVIDVGEDERAWSFTPAQPWTAGRYRLRVSPDLEDPAGNSLERVFDAELATLGPSGGATPAERTREFVVTTS